MNWHTARFAAICATCRSDIGRGDEVLWLAKRPQCFACGRKLETRAAFRDERRREAVAHGRSCPDAT